MDVCVVAEPVSSAPNTAVRTSQESEVYVNLKFDFNIHSIKAVLYTGDTTLVGKPTVDIFAIYSDKVRKILKLCMSQSLSHLGAMLIRGLC